MSPDPPASQANTPLSGVEQPFGPEDALWYRRHVALDEKEGKRTLLNFEAVDYFSMVWVNHVKMGGNFGGNLPFSVDVTGALAPEAPGTTGR